MRAFLPASHALSSCEALGAADALAAVQHYLFQAPFVLEDTVTLERGVL